MFYGLLWRAAKHQTANKEPLNEMSHPNPHPNANPGQPCPDAGHAANPGIPPQAVEEYYHCIHCDAPWSHRLDYCPANHSHTFGWRYAHRSHRLRDQDTIATLERRVAMLTEENTKVHNRLGRLINTLGEQTFGSALAAASAQVNTIATLRENVQERQQRVDRLEVQLAGCLTAAEGHNTHPAKQGDYGWSPAYQAVLDLRRAYEQLLHPRPGCVAETPDPNDGPRLGSGIQATVTALEDRVESMAHALQKLQSQVANILDASRGLR